MCHTSTKAQKKTIEPFSDFVTFFIILILKVLTKSLEWFLELFYDTIYIGLLIYFYSIRLYE